MLLPATTATTAATTEKWTNVRGRHEVVALFLVLYYCRLGFVECSRMNTIYKLVIKIDRLLKLHVGS